MCLEELRDARRAGLLAGSPLSSKALAGQAAKLTRFGDPKRLLDAEWQLMNGVADELGRSGYGNLGRLLASRPAEGTPLLVLAVRYFFRRAVEEDPKLFQGLAWASWEQIGQAQERGFARLGEALAEQQQLLDRRLSQLSLHLAQIHGAVLDIQQEQERQGAQHRDIYQAVIGLQLRFDVLAHEVQPDGASQLHSEDERQLIGQVVEQYRALPADLRSQLPALLKGIAKLQLWAGDEEEAEKSFHGVTVTLADSAVRAESHFCAFQAAIERGDWAKAVSSCHQAIHLDPARWTIEHFSTELATAMQVSAEEARQYIRQRTR